jgi:hypothetical protein
MNAKTLIALATLTAVTAGFAQEAPMVSFPTASTVTRAQVQADARSATLGEAPVAALPGPSSVQLPRAAVKAEAAQAGRDRELPVGELLGFERHTTHPSARRAALIASR